MSERTEEAAGEELLRGKASRAVVKSSRGYLYLDRAGTVNRRGEKCFYPLTTVRLTSGLRPCDRAARTAARSLF